MKEDYKIDNLKVKKEKWDFDVYDQYFCLRVSSTVLGTNSLGRNIIPLKLTFLSEDVISISIDKSTLNPIIKTKSYTLPLVMINSFFDMLKEKWLIPSKHTMSDDVILNFLNKLK